MTRIVRFQDAPHMQYAWSFDAYGLKLFVPWGNAAWLVTWTAHGVYRATGSYIR